MKMFRMGEGKGHTLRHRSNLITHSGNPSNMRLYHKDHKGPGSTKMRRVNGPGLNTPFSNLLAKLLEPIAGDMKGRLEKGSTESVLSVGDVYNAKIVTKRNQKMCRELVEQLVDGLGLVRAGDPAEGLVGRGEAGKGGEFQKGVGSEVITGLDAVGLYPSIKKKLAMSICREVAEETEVKVDHMNLLEATRFLVLTWPKDRVKNSDIRGYLPVRRQIEGKKLGTLGLTTQNSLGATPNDQSQWTWPKVKVPSNIKKKISRM